MSNLRENLRERLLIECNCNINDNNSNNSHYILKYNLEKIEEELEELESILLKCLIVI